MDYPPHSVMMGCRGGVPEVLDSAADKVLLVDFNDLVVDDNVAVTLGHAPCLLARHEDAEPV